MPQEQARPLTPPSRLHCLVTGGLGYAGAWIVHHLAAQGHTVFAMSRGARKPDLKVNYSLITGDVETMSPEELAVTFPEKLDVVIHAASCNEAFEPDYPRRALLTNGLGTRNMLEALFVRKVRHNAVAPLFIYLSTIHVYGATRERVVTEDCSIAPINDYALTHHVGEEYCRMYSRCGDIPSIIVRISNGYGMPKTASSNKWYLLVNDLCKSAVFRGKIVLHSSPGLTRDFIWLGDVAAAIGLLADRYDLAGEVFNLSSGTAWTIGYIASLVSEEASRMLQLSIPVEFPSPSGNAGVRDATCRYDNSHLAEVTGFAAHDKLHMEIRKILSLLITEAAATADVEPSVGKQGKA